MSNKSNCAAMMVLFLNRGLASRVILVQTAQAIHEYGNPLLAAQPIEFGQGVAAVVWPCDVPCGNHLIQKSAAPV
jgi:hypothetical protein